MKKELDQLDYMTYIADLTRNYSVDSTFRLLEEGVYKLEFECDYFYFAIGIKRDETGDDSIGDKWYYYKIHNKKPHVASHCNDFREFDEDFIESVNKDLKVILSHIQEEELKEFVTKITEYKGE